MIVRALLAVFGAIVITVGLLLAMDNVISVFREDSGERFYRITNFIPRTEPRRPDRPEPVVRQPGTSIPTLRGSDTSVPISITVEAPTAPDLEAASRELVPARETGANRPEGTNDSIPAPAAAPPREASPDPETGSASENALAPAN